MYFLFHQQSPIGIFHLNYTLGLRVRSVCHVLLLSPSLSEQTDKRLQGAAPCDTTTLHSYTTYFLFLGLIVGPH